MKKTLLLMSLILGVSCLAHATPCGSTGDSLADYIALPATGCTVGDLTFSDFNYFPSSFDATVPPAGSVDVDPVTGVESGLQFASGWAVGAGAFEDALISYTVTCDGCLVDDWVLQTGGAASSGDGVVDVSESSPEVAGQLIQVTQGTSATEGVSSGTFTPVGSLSVDKDIFVYGGTATNTQVSSVTNLFSTITTPEPPLLLLSVGLLGLAPFARRKFVR